MVNEKIEDFSGEGESVTRPLSLLVDGEDIVEAILVFADKMYCYPCRLEEWVKTVVSFLKKLFATHVVPLQRGYAIVGCGESKVVAVPLPQDRFLAVVAKEYIDGEKLARYLNSLPDRLATVLEKKGRSRNRRDGKT